ncbi:hypothetical protein SAMN05216474_1522 [Lishizhenia tianjinensis]|uniref:Lipoprotein n=1 Tax=Lishizhenia tianjinensis TaxID=477690 RepID=A0A1I6ZPB8_9FLAO|nr:hypothetical protein [Lishizhenia tianjinensis]SFT64559.1 hypothetical protein SAMN05216474_1522 [Lishizhenia tianjinensis]
MYKRFSLVLLFSTLFVLTSCFEIIEDLTLNKDGSGSLKVKLNMSASATKLKGIMALDSLDGKPVPSKADILDSLNKYVALVEKEPGISDVKATMDFDYFVFNLSLNFDSIAALEQAVNKYTKEEGEYSWMSWKEGNFERKSLAILNPIVKKIKAKDKAKLHEATYVSITRFKDGEVKDMTNPGAVLAANKKAVMQRFNVGEVIDDPDQVKNTVTVK